MRRSGLRVVAAVALATALATAGVWVHPARATHTPVFYEPLEDARLVHVGGGELRNDVVSDLEVQFMSFYPETMQVHRGQTVEFRFAPGFATLHTVTFLPADMDVQQAPSPLEDAHDHLVRADEVPGAIALSEGAMLGSDCGLIFPDAANGREAQDPCHVDSTGERYGSQLSDALFNIFERQPQGFAVTVDLAPGRYRYHCNFHPSMHGYIEVVADEVALPTQEAIDAQARIDLERDRATAIDLHRTLSKPTSTLDGDQRVWTVHAGATSADQRVSINDYMPADLEVEVGDAVRFVAAGVEPNSVTFPSEPVGSFTLEGCDTSSCVGHLAPVGLVILAAPWSCEYDDPGAGSPGVASFIPGIGCPAGGQVEWQLSHLAAEQTHAPRDLIATSATFHNSGFMFDDRAHLPQWYIDRPGAPDWPTTFDAVFPTEGTYTYSCLLHTGDVATEDVTGDARSGMVGTIRVEAPS